MPLPAPAHLLVSLRGTLGTAGISPEQWQCGLRFTVGSSPSDVQKLAAVEAAQTWITETAMRFTPETHLTELRFHDIAATGAQIGATGVTPAAASGAGTAAAHPWQDTIVLTLVCDGRGKGTKGRIFMPPQGFTVDTTTGLVPDNEVTPMLSPCAAFLGQLETAVSGQLVVIGHAGVTGPASANEVHRIRIGHVCDTMRSRRRSLVESYVQMELAA